MQEGQEETLIVHVYLKSGKFEGKIQIPLFTTKEAREKFIESWLDLMAAGLKAGGCD